MADTNGYWQADDKSTATRVVLSVVLIAVIMTGVAIGIGLVL
ncbi:MAG TPA: hypothetical protein PKZ68_03540 [Pseudomonadales bacterium]|jgi:F0F1-type ATP synthase assembly protein I|nr:hypothetical protein [Pseudomonadales bacterium]HNI37350.1 hypothetical protein [Pseudomonadales bacterium]